MLKSSLSLCLLILFLAGCKENNNGSNPVSESTGKYTSTKKDQTKDVLWPLKTGNYWIYDVSIRNDEGNFQKAMTDTLSVDSLLTIGDEQWFMLYDHFGDPDSPSKDPLIISNTDIGVWLMAGDDFLAPDYLLARYPSGNNSVYSNDCVASIKYTFTDSTKGSYGYAGKIQAKRNIKVQYYEKTAVPAGTFDCLKYTESFDKLIDPASKVFELISAVNYYAENIGLIKREFYINTYNDGKISDSKLLFRYELARYKLN